MENIVQKSVEWYGIKPFYKHREFAMQSESEIHVRDECQDSVYKTAHELAEKCSIKTVLDIGCGGGFKLLKYFGKYLKCGLDTPETVHWLREHYPLESWAVSPLCRPGSIWCMWKGFEMIICSDMIEHVPDPDLVLDFIASVRPKIVILSTPDRERTPREFWDGPPRNISHYREWNFAEFEKYASTRFRVLNHFYPDPVDASQVVVAEVE